MRARLQGGRAGARRGRGGGAGRPGRFQLSGLRIFLRLFRYLAPYKGRVAILLVFTLVTTGLGLVFPPLMKVLVDDVFGKSRHELLLPVAGVLLAVSVVNSVLRYIYNYFREQVSHRIIRTLRNEMFDRMVTLRLPFFEQRQTGHILARVVSDTEAVQNAAFHSAETLFSSGIMLIAVIVILFVVNPRLALWTLTPVPLLIASVVFYSITLKKRYSIFREKVAELNAFVQERISGIRVVKSFTREDREREEMDRKTTDFYDAIMGAARISASIMPWVSFIFGLGSLVIIFAGGRMVASGATTVGTLMMFIFYLHHFYGPIGQIGRLIGHEIPRAVASAERVFEFLDEEDRLPVPPDAVRPESLQGEVEFRGVTFSYGEEDVLHDIDLHVAPRETVALVGPSGSGKTTLVELISRFYEVENGQVLVDGVHVKKYDPRALRRHIGVVMQEPFLFDASVTENIAYGRPDATDEDVRDVAVRAEVDQFVRELPEGYDTVLGERGVKLSVGQKQRVSIARALLRDPAILILDEATSAVDTVTEQAIQRALERAAEGRTTILIAHRLSTTFMADRIVVVDEGRIVEQGPPRELLERGGIFTQLYNMQLLEGRLGEGDVG
jgi:ABC-type multidrug transport system fused ATPase/permease subunit